MEFAVQKCSLNITNAFFLLLIRVAFNRKKKRLLIEMSWSVLIIIGTPAFCNRHLLQCQKDLNTSSCKILSITVRK